MGKQLSILICSLGILLGIANTTKATHIYGGDISYVYLRDSLGGAFHIYAVTMTMYQDCNSANWGGAFPEQSVPIHIYEGALNATSLPLNTRRAIAQLGLIENVTIQSNLPGGCALTGGSCIAKTVYAGITALPTSFTGYHFIYDRCCRTDGVTNVNVPVNSRTDGTLLHSWTASTSTKNTSPKFRDFDFPFICVGRENGVLNIAQDPDGDLLNYSLYAPFDGLAQNGNYNGGYATFPPSNVNYRTTPDVYTAQKPLGNGGNISLNGLTGYTTMRSNVSGIYVVGVKVTEIDKNGNTIGIVHREYQFPFVNCNDTNSASPTLIGGKSNYEVDAGDTLCFDIEFEDKGGSPVNYLYRVEGLIFDTNFTKPPATLTNPVFGANTSQQTFCWETTCEQGRSTNYYFTASVADSACVPNTNNVVFEVKVNPAETPKVINGPTSLCAGASNVEYSTDTIAGLVYNWTVTGGSIIAGGSGPSITVDWGNGPGGNIQVSGVNSTGCTGDTIDLAVFVATFPVNPGNDQLICTGDTATLGSTGGLSTAPPGYSIKWSPSATVDNDTLQNPKAFPSVTTDYVLTVTDSTGQCKVVDTVTITVGINPAASVSNDTTLCEGNQTTLIATGGTIYDWSPGTLLNDSTIPNPVTNITADQMFIVKIEDPGNACPVFDTVFVTIDGQSDLNPGMDDTICIGSIDTLGGTPTGVLNATFNWSPAGQLSNATDSNPIFSSTTTGLNTFFVTMTTPAGCIFNDSVKINVDTIPQINILFGRNSICSGDTTYLEATGGNTYLWSDATLIGAGPHTVSPTSDTKYVLSGTDLNQCASKDSVTIVVKPNPEILIPFDTIFLCNLDTLTIPTTTGAGSYTWTPNYNINNTTAAQPRVFPRTDTTYIVNIQNFNGCDAIDSLYIEVGGEVPTDAGLPQTLCAPDTIQIGGNPTARQFNTTYSWTPTNTLILPTSGNPRTFSDTSQMYRVTTVNGSCGGIDSVLITVKNRPTITFTRNPYEVCKGDTLTLDTLSSTGFITSIVIFPPPTNVIGGSGVNLRLVPDTSVVYNIVLADSNSCTDTSQLAINVVNPPNVVASNDTSECAGTPFQLSVTGASTYDWSPSNLLDKPNSSTPVAVADTTTQFIVTGTTQAGCFASDTVLITINQLPMVDAGNPHVVCSDTVNTIRLGGNPTGASSTRYVWSPATDLDNPNTANPICTFTLPRTYLVLAVDTNGCVNSDTADIRIYSFKANNVTAECSGDSIQLNLYDTFGTKPFNFQWIPETGLSDPTLPNPKVSVEESTTFKVIMTDSVGCVDSILIDVSVKETVKADFDLLVQADCDNTTVIVLNQSENVDEFNWFLNGDFISDLESPQFTFPYNSEFSVSLIALSADSCVATADSSSVSLNFEDYFTGNIPNVFTPNGDGINDLFDFRLGNRLEQCSNIQVYNRWGALVFESRENAHIWDGRTFTGEMCSEGQYFYILEVNSTTYKGSLTLIKD